MNKILDQQQVILCDNKKSMSTLPCQNLIWKTLYIIYIPYVIIFRLFIYLI